MLTSVSPASRRSRASFCWWGKFVRPPHLLARGLGPCSSFPSPRSDQLPLELREPRQHREHKPAMGRGGVSPGVAQGAEGCAPLRHRGQHVEKVARGAREPIQPGHQHHVAGRERGQQARELRRHSSEAHKALAKRFAEADLGRYKFTRHMVIGSAIVDFGSHLLGMAIAIDEEGQDDAIAKRRDKSLEAVDVRVMRIAAKAYSGDCCVGQLRCVQYLATRSIIKPAPSPRT